MKNLYSKLKPFIKKIISDNISAYSAQSCFYIALSFLPFLLVIISLTRYLAITDIDFITLISNVVPANLSPVFSGVISDIYNNASLTLTSITALTALWSSGRGFIAIISGLNKIYGIDKHTRWFKLRIQSTICTIVFIVLIITSLILLIFGNTLITHLQKVAPAIADIIIMLLGKKIIIFPTFLTILFTVIYTYIPDRKSSLKKELPGAVITALGWYVFSHLYSFYIAFFPGISYIYRSMTSLILTLLWIYFSVIIIFLGAEINCYITTRSKTHSKNDVPG